jgi:hypothetical protein
MTARLQAASTSGLPILLLYDAKAGHAGGEPFTKVVEDSTYELYVRRLAAWYEKVAIARRPLLGRLVPNSSLLSSPTFTLGLGYALPPCGGHRSLLYGFKRDSGCGRSASAF